jgi:pterin-4a-carbinolamine dehydratase
MRVDQLAARANYAPSRIDAIDAAYVFRATILLVDHLLHRVTDPDVDMAERLMRFSEARAALQEGLAGGDAKLTRSMP